jgi:hypothetical protein
MNARKDLEIYILALEMVESGYIQKSQIDSFIEIKTKTAAEREKQNELPTKKT